MVEGTKKFSGKVYELQSMHETKKWADKRANHWRERGHLVRMIKLKLGESYPFRYAIYSREK